MAFATIGSTDRGKPVGFGKKSLPVYQQGRPYSQVVSRQGYYLLVEDGVSVVPGLYFLGSPWMRSQKSTILFGILEDAAFIVDKLYSEARKNALSIPGAV